MPKIKTLTAKSLRGIVETTLELNNRSVVLLGENGTGKSSFVDALEFFFMGRIGHLEGTQSVSTSRHAPHIHAGRNDMVVEIEFDQPGGAVSRTFNELSPVPSELINHINLGANSTFILRRKNLLDFILAQPAPRYEQLAAIIGVNDLDKVERALMQARDELQSQKQSSEHQLNSEEQKLKELLKEKVTTVEHILAALNRKLGELGQPPLKSLDEIEDRKLEIFSKSRSPEETQRAAKVQDLLPKTVHLMNNVLFAEDYRKLWKEVEDLRQNVKQLREMLFQEVLTSSRRLLTDFELDHCPVCLQPIDREALLASLEKRIRDAEQIARKSSEIKQLGLGLAEQVRNQIDQIEQLIVQVLELDLDLDKLSLEQYIVLMESLLTDLQADPVDMHLTSLNNLVETSEVKAFSSSLKDLQSTLQSEKKRLEQTEQDKLAIKVIDLLTRVKDGHQALVILRPQCRVKSATYYEMSAIYDCFVNTKRQEIQSIYRDLEEDIKRFFQLLHADEGYRGLRLDVKEGRRASTEIRMDFHEREREDPRAFNSEGHLDSLGLCIFLAFVKRFNAGFPLLVLDDVVSSIDSGHRQRVCDLLFQEFGDYQLFITTHDYVWFEELAAYQRTHNKQHLFTNFQIIDWSVDSGPRLDKYKPRWDRAEEKLANGDKDGAAADARKALEFFLYEIAVATRTSVEIKRDSRYVVSELHDPFVKRIKKLAPDVYNNNLAKFEALEKNAIFGNMLVHNNPRAANASLEEVKNFMNAVKDIETLFSCSECGRLVEYHRTARLIKCRCGAVMWSTRG
ncbi:MAG: hypothetical protein KDJ65_08175 [Anaerolineae bacterium]|nr:hypothetical protein [Anaerolineae bacterium]